MQIRMAPKLFRARWLLRRRYDSFGRGQDPYYAGRIWKRRSERICHPDTKDRLRRKRRFRSLRRRHTESHVDFHRRLRLLRRLRIRRREPSFEESASKSAMSIPGLVAGTMLRKQRPLTVVETSSSIASDNN